MARVVGMSTGPAGLSRSGVGVMPSPAGEPARGRVLREAILIALGVGLVYTAWSLSPLLLAGAFQDDGTYLALGKAIASGAGYRSIYLPGAPVEVKYPPGLPLLLAALWSAGGTLELVRRLAVWLDVGAVALSAGLIWAYGRRRLAPLPLACLAIVPLLLDAAVQYGTLVIAEPYYLLGWAACLCLIPGLMGARAGPRLARAALLGLVLAATTLFRTQGLVLVAAIVFGLALQRAGTLTLLAVAAAALVPLLAWIVIQRHMLGMGPRATQLDERSYLSFLSDGITPAAIGANAREYLTVFSAYLSRWRPVGGAAFLLFLLLALVGSVREAQRDPVLVASVLGNLGLLLVWPFSQDRLLVDILPFAGLLAAAAVRGMGRGGRLPRMACSALLLLAACAVLVRQVAIQRGARQALVRGTDPGMFTPSYMLPANSRAIYAISRWVLTHTSLQDRLLVSDHTGVYLYTARQAVTSGPVQNASTFSTPHRPGEYVASSIVTDGVTVVVLDNLHAPAARDIAALQRRCPGSLVYAGNAGVGTLPMFYRVRPLDACLAALVK